MLHDIARGVIMAAEVNAMEKFLTAEQVAEALQVHLDTVRLWLRTGQLRGVKVGRAWRIPERELHALANGTTTNRKTDSAS